MSDENPQPPPQQEVRFNHIKSNLFRTVHADGIWSSIGPRDNLHLTFYSERLAIPTETAYTLTPNGELGEEIYARRSGKPDYVRELEIDVVLDWRNVINLHEFLGNYIEKNRPKAPTQPVY